MTDETVKAISERADNGIVASVWRSGNNLGMCSWCDYCSFYCPRRVPDGD